MRVSPSQLWLLFALGCLPTRFTAVEGKSQSIGPEEACADFKDDNQPGSAWTLADCTEVWTQYAQTLPGGLRKRLRYTDHLREPAEELRQAGLPCLAVATARGDGVGSTTIRILSSWLLAKEMGCDWVTPDWGKRHVNGGNGTVMYCHRTSRGDADLANLPQSTLVEKTRCSVVDWLSFFQFGVPSVDLPEGANIKEVKVGVKSLDAIASAIVSLKEGKNGDQEWDRVVFKFDLSFASRHFLSLGNWDEDRRQLARTIIGQARQNFHVHPRPW